MGRRKAMKKHEIPSSLDNYCCDFCGYEFDCEPWEVEICPECLSAPRKSDEFGPFDDPAPVVCCESYSMSRIAPVEPKGQYGVPNAPERIYLDQWRRENHRGRVNGGTPLLWLLRGPDSRELRMLNRGRMRRWWTYQETNIDEERIAASVIQWLGTACGRGFIRMCEQRIEGLREAGRRSA